jgi:hypothetical protein
MAPTSIAYSGTSAGINADGGVDFTAVTSLSLNGVFTSDYDNYLIVFRGSCTTFDNLLLRMRVAGSSDSGSNYTYQYLYADGSTAAGSRSSSQTSTRIGNISSAQRDGISVHVYGPALAQPTAIRSVTVNGQSNARIDEFASTHNQSTSYDGFELLASAFTGNIHVFGYEE